MKKYRLRIGIRPFTFILKTETWCPSQNRGDAWLGSAMNAALARSA
jgi:hypothetical protein